MSSDGLLNEPVLILNVNFEPLHVCTTKRAIALILSGKAEIIVNGRGTIKSSHSEYEIPSVVRLGYSIKRPRLKVTLSKREILRRDNFTCQYCGRKTRTLTLDHVIPRHQGGQNTWLNLVTACPSCNRHKGGSRLEDVNMKLHRMPFEPRPTVGYIFGRHLEQHQEWAQFIEGW